MNKQTILIVEDEDDLAKLLADYIAQAGFTPHIIQNGLDVEPWLAENSAALIVLDLMLPGKNGLDICKDLRQSDTTPIIICTAKIEEIDRLIGLELGADDYICKPFSPREVVARIKTILRRITPSSDGTPKIQHWNIDEDKLKATLYTQIIELTQIELNLLKLLTESPGKIYSRQHILDNLYHDYRIVSDRTVDSHIKKLRKKIHDALPEKDLIKSIYGVGYKFEPDDDD